MKKQYYVYIVTNKWNTTLYTGVTGDLWRRISEHKMKTTPGFTARYNINKLIYYEVFEEPTEALMAEKKIKGGSRKKKFELIKGMNSAFNDLTDEIASLRSQ